MDWTTYMYVNSSVFSFFQNRSAEYQTLNSAPPPIVRFLSIFLSSRKPHYLGIDCSYKIIGSILLEKWHNNILILTRSAA